MEHPRTKSFRVILYQGIAPTFIIFGPHRLEQICPEVVNFQGPSFDPDLFWARLVSLLQAGCPIGCGTSAMTLEELGLVGQHAYSVLEAEDGGGFFVAALGPDGDGRRVKVRNPWGEWTRREQDELLAQLGVAITPGDGCFWMNYSDFIRGFACADICYARAGWHSQSFDLEFDGHGEGLGVRSALKLRSVGGAVECWVMGIQPTERGKQVKRPKGRGFKVVRLCNVISSF